MDIEPVYDEDGNEFYLVPYLDGAEIDRMRRKYRVMLIVSVILGVWIGTGLASVFVTARGGTPGPRVSVGYATLLGSIIKGPLALYGWI